jgi:hypothetical protein
MGMGGWFIRSSLSWMGYFLWEQIPDFHLQAHFHLDPNPRPIPRAEFVERIGGVWAESLGSPSGGECGGGGGGPRVEVLFKFHHALGDGPAIFQALISSGDEAVRNYVPPK